MAFLDEGTPRWTDCLQSGGSGATAITGATDDNLLVVLSRAVGAKYDTANLTTAATDVIAGVTAGADSFESPDPYSNASPKLVRVKTSEKMRVRTATAYVAANYGKGIAADQTTNQEGWAIVAATGGVGRIVGGETIDGKHYLDFWMNEASPR